MVRLFKAFLFKISKDLTFRVTLIIGAGMAILMTGIYAACQYGLLALDGVDESGGLGIKFISGQGMLINSMSPAQNYGLAIPINLITFICLEFSQGTIRNKIIAGHSKFKIYVSLFVGGLIFAFALLGVYLLICTGLGSIFGGFNLNDTVYLLTGGIAQVTGEYLFKMIVICIVTYLSIVSFAIFISTAFRSIGPSIPIILVPIMILYFTAMIISMLGQFGISDAEGIQNVMRFANPFYGIASLETEIVGEGEAMRSVAIVSNKTFITSVCSNVVYAGIFFAAGSLLFSKRDIK